MEHKESRQTLVVCVRVGDEQSHACQACSAVVDTATASEIVGLLDLVHGDVGGSWSVHFTQVSEILFAMRVIFLCRYINLR